MAELADAYV